MAASGRRRPAGGPAAALDTRSALALGIAMSLNSPIPDQKYGEEIMAFVVKQPGQELNAEELIQYTKEKMTPFKAPSSVQFVEGLPKSLVGKVLKKELRKLV